MKELQPGEWRVALTTRSEDLNNEREWEERYCSTLDRFYALVSEEELEREAAAKARAARARHLTHRPIRYTPGSSRPCSRKHSMSCVTFAKHAGPSSKFLHATCLVPCLNYCSLIKYRLLMSVLQAVQKHLPLITGVWCCQCRVAYRIILLFLQRSRLNQL